MIITSSPDHLYEGDRANAGSRGKNYGSLREDFIAGNGQTQTHTVPTTGNMSYLAASDKAGVAIHESLHLLGLGDRYTDAKYSYTVPGKEGTFTTGEMSKAHIGFETDMMNQSSTTSTFSQVHIDNLASNAMKLNAKSGGSNSAIFFSARKVDSASNRDLTVIPQTFKSGNITYNLIK